MLGFQLQIYLTYAAYTFLGAQDIKEAFMDVDIYNRVCMKEHK